MTPANMTPPILTPAQKRMYLDICIEDSYRYLKNHQTTAAHAIIKAGVAAAGPNIYRVMGHLKYLIDSQSTIFGIHILSQELGSFDDDH